MSLRQLIVLWVCVGGCLWGESDPAGATEALSSEPAVEQSAPDFYSWRERYTMGPGDVVNIRFYGRSELDRSGITIAPDGSLSYLQVNSLPVAGMMVGELRAALEHALSEYYREPRLIVMPFALQSKRYVILGKIIDKGVFTLDRPITLLEAIARSRGIETGLVGDSTREIADMERSFIVRRGERLDVDFAKLYYEGDFSQNVYLEPQDYIFLASNLANEFYVFGSVAFPGNQSFSNGVGLISAITASGGFTERAWTKRVLLVRGSLSNPAVQVVNAEAILAGRELDIPVQPGDIVYVNDRPWRKTEALLDTVVRRFLQSATSTWANENVPDLIADPLLKRQDWRD